MAVSSNLDRYRRISMLGAGGMATVELAVDELLGRRVALKRMAAPRDGIPVTAEPRALARLKREALLGASISHPNLVAIYDVVNAENGELVIVMEYVPGETLADAIARHGRLPPRQALPILSGVASGLDAIHRRGIVHRDIKPANILLGDGGAVKLADLGIASVPDRTRITSAGAVLGSFRYMAPEQLEDAPATPAIDVYALSAVAFEVLSGQAARREANPVALAHAIVSHPPPDLRDAWPEAPAPAAELLTRGLAREATERPGSAGELARRLREALEPQTAAPPPGPQGLATPSGSRRPRRAVAAAGAAAIAEKAAARPDERAFTGTSGRASGAPAPPPRRPDPPIARSGAAAGRQRRLAPALAAVAVLVVAGIVLALALSGGNPKPPAASRSQTAAGPGSALTPRGPRASAHPRTRPGAVSSAAERGPAAAEPRSTPAATGSAPGAAGRSGNPVSTVETFYGFAAAHRYQQAWALADATFRQQLGGYGSFAAGQAGDRSITFDSARVVSQSASAATVAVQTTSVRYNGTQHCGGTVDLLPAGGSWRINMIHINCT